MNDTSQLESEDLQDLYSNLINTIVFGSAIVDSSTFKILEYNETFYHIFDCESFQSFLDYSRINHLNFFDHEILKSLKEGEYLYKTVKIKSKKGKDLWLRLDYRRSRNGNIIEVFINDITKPIQLDIELRKALFKAEIAQKKAEEAEQEKSDFLASISHELRTPLTGILGFGDILLANLLPHDENFHYVRRIVGEAQQLKFLIDQLIDHSKLDRSHLKLDFESFYLNDLLRDIVDLLQSFTRKKNIEIQLISDSNLNNLIYGDPFRLKQIFYNLCSNSIKFTSEGYIRLQTKLIKRNSEGYHVHFDIIDTGSGISEGIRPYIFNRFFTSDHSITRENPGMGLGLFISSELVKLMGGVLTCESEVGKGTNFCFDLVFKEGSIQHGPIRQQIKPLALKEYTFIQNKDKPLILVVEDDPTIQEIIRFFLKKAGYDSISKYSGIKGLDLLKTKKVDLILMDLHMPVLDGLEATRIIKKDPNLESIPILGMSADSRYRMYEDCLKAGMVDLVLKPIQQKDLIYKIESLLSQKLFEEEKFMGELKESLREFTNFFGGTVQEVFEIFIGFQSQLKERVEQMIFAEKNKNYKDLYEEVHALKGAVLNLHLKQLIRLCNLLDKELIQFIEGETQSLDPALLEKVLKECQVILDLSKEDILELVNL